jgi:DNA-binding GntR family transcriptional regulator
MMTLPRIPTKSRSPVTPDDPPLASFRPLSAPRRLTHELVERLTAEITSGKLAPGARLPTEQEMIAATGVSRTVVREAVAALRAEGLVVTRQGAGAFVASGAHRPFRINAGELRSLREVLDAMELRTGIEIEAAGLAAERASAVQVRDIARALDRSIGRSRTELGGRPGLRVSLPDRAGDRQSAFVRFLEYLGRFIIPRQTVRVAAGSGPASLFCAIPEGVPRYAPLAPGVSGAKGALGHAAPPREQPQALSEAWRRAGRRVIVPAARETEP